MQESQTAFVTKPPFMERIFVCLEYAIIDMCPFSPWMQGKFASGVKPQDSSSSTSL